MNNVQERIDRYYHTAYDAIWAKHAAGKIDTDTALELTEKAHDRAWQRIERETGYRLARGRNEA